MDLSILRRGSGEVEELFALICRKTSDITIHIPKKRNRTLDHMSQTDFSSDDGEPTRIEEMVELMSREEIKNSNIRVLWFLRF